MLFAVGMNRRAFLRQTCATTLLLAGTPDWAAERASNSDSLEILEEAPEKIASHRKRDIKLILSDASGKRLPGATIEIEQLRHEFLFGCNFFGFGRCGDASLEDQYRNRFAALLNYATLGFYWSSYEFVKGRPSYDYTDQVVDWTRKQGIITKGHPLVWDHPAGSPRWLTEDAAEILKLSTARVREIVSRFKGRIDIWDVVNEATHLPDKANKTTMAKWALEMGAVPYVEKHLREARDASSSATLLVNDYRTDPPYYRILEALKENKAPFDCVGIQSHMHGQVWTAKRVWDTCETYAKLDLPLHFTETTIVSGPRKGPGENWGETQTADEQKQAEETVKFYTTLFAHPAVEAITWWDFSDLRAWQRAPAGWLRKDMSPKPVYEQLLDLVKKQWWTRLTTTSNSEGVASFSGFLGSYRLSVKKPGSAEGLSKELYLKRTSSNEVQIIV